MDLVTFLMWGRIWVALLVQSPQIHLHTFTSFTHTQVFALRKYTLQKVGSVVVCITRCKGGHIPLHLAAVPAGARIQRFGGKSVDSTSGLSSGFFPRMAKRPQCSTQSTSA